MTSLDTKDKRQMHLIAGPCSAESREQVLTTAQQLKAFGVDTFRAGLWKPRSRYGSFEGRGEQAVPWMKEVQQLGMKIMTEVALPKHVEIALKGGFDALWIGARTVVNPFLMEMLAEELSGVDIPVYVKNPVCPDLALWGGAIDRLRHHNVNKLYAIHRGFNTLDSAPYRNAPVWEYMDKFIQHFPEIPLYVDPSHMAGKRELIQELCEQSLNYNIAGFFIESHVCPAQALSDAPQQLTPEDLHTLMDNLRQQ